MKIILKGIILDLVTLKIIRGCGRQSLNSQCCDEGAMVLLGYTEENVERSKKDGLESQGERVGMMELRAAVLPSAAQCVHGGAAGKPPFSVPSNTSLTLHPKQMQSHLEKHTQFWLPQLPRDTEILEDSEKIQKNPKWLQGICYLLQHHILNRRKLSFPAQKYI